MKVLFVGTGLIGGSFSLAMQKHGLLSEAGGFSRKESNLDRSVELGLISKKFTNLEDGIKWADWVILSIPVDVIDQILPGSRHYDHVCVNTKNSYAVHTNSVTE